MGYRLRLDSAGAWHHVMNRGAGRRMVFRDDVDRAIFMDSLSELPERFGVGVHAFCLMGNHFHLLVRSHDGRLSAAMQWLGSGFTRRVNGRRAVDGAIFRGRFHSVDVTRSSHAKYLVRYIHANPREFGWERPLDVYPWSSLAQYTGIVDPSEWLEQRTVLGWFDGDRHRLGQYVECSEPDVPAGVLIPVGDVVDCLDDIVEAVELARSMIVPTPRVDAARLAAILLAHDATTISPDDVLVHFGMKRASLRSALCRARHRASTDVGFARMVAITTNLLRGDVALRV